MTNTTENGSTDTFRATWETYTSSWKAQGAAKASLLDAAVRDDAVYTDPLAQTTSREGLIAYMREFHKLFPGSYFHTTYFLAHNRRSIARWEMRNGEDAVLSEGMSYGEYDAEGKLVSMTGFYETPDA